jgi:hypothetical protein
VRSAERQPRRKASQEIKRSRDHELKSFFFNRPNS